MKKELVKLANHLDNIGHGDLADRLDDILKSAEEDEDTELLEVPPLPLSDVGSSTTTPGPPAVTPEDLAKELAKELAKKEYDAASQRIAGGNGNDADKIIVAEYEAKEDDLTEGVTEGLTDGAFDSPAEAEALAFDEVFAANSAQERIDKLAELMSGEFTTYTPGTFSR